MARDCPVLLEKLQQQQCAAAEGGEKAQVPWEMVPYASLQIMDISVLREYLAHMLRPEVTPTSTPNPSPSPNPNPKS